MTPRRVIALRAVLAILCAYHLGIGLATTISARATVAFGTRFYGLTVEEVTPTFLVMLKALGMYAVFTGILLALATWRPLRHRAVIGAAILLLTMRAFTRLTFHGALEDAFGLTRGHNLFNVALLLLQAGALAWAMAPALQRSLARTEREAGRLAGRASARLRPVLVPRRASARFGHLASGVR